MNAQVQSARSVSRGNAAAGFALVEGLISVAIIAVSLGAMMTLNGQQLRLVKVSKNVNAASLYQQERVEQLRQLRWPDLTSGTFIANTYLPNRPLSQSALDKISETIRVAAYPRATQGSQPLKVDQAVSGVTTIGSTENGFALENERLVKVSLTLRWTGADGKTQERSTATLISNSGITRSNLPAMGPVSGGPYEAFNTSSTPGPVTATPAPTTGSSKPKRGNTGGKNGGG